MGAVAQPTAGVLRHPRRGPPSPVVLAAAGPVLCRRFQPGTIPDARRRAAQRSAADAAAARRIAAAHPDAVHTCRAAILGLSFPALWAGVHRYPDGPAARPSGARRGGGLGSGGCLWAAFFRGADLWLLVDRAAVSRHVPPQARRSGPARRNLWTERDPVRTGQ